MTITCFCCDVSPEECLTLRAINEEARERAAGAQSKAARILGLKMEGS